MRMLNHVAQFTYISYVGLTLITPARAVRAASLPMPTGTQLTATITKLDANLFASYNDCNLVSLDQHLREAAPRACARNARGVSDTRIRSP